MICSYGLPVEHTCRTCVEDALAKEEARKPKSVKMRKCSVCKLKFIPRRPMQSACSYPATCEAIKAERLIEKEIARREKRDRLQTKNRLAELDGMPKLVKRAQAAFNAFIRARDRDQTCIDCGKPLEPNKPGGSVDAGHYIARGAAAHLKFMEDNCHAQRKNCNRPGGATRQDYRNGLIARIGLARVEAIECDQTSRNYTRQELVDLAAHYRKLARDLLK